MMGIPTCLLMFQKILLEISSTTRKKSISSGIVIKGVHYGRWSNHND